MIIKSRSADVVVPEISLAVYLLQITEQYGDKPALVDGATGRSYSYADFARLTRNFAANLADRGFRKGDTFALYSPNLPEYAIAFFGIVLAGGTVTTVNPLYTADELIKQLQDCSASYILTVDLFKENALIAAKSTAVKDVFTFDNADYTVAFSELLQPNTRVPDPVIDPYNDLVVLPYSSGTTGVSKGVMLTHHNIIANVLQVDNMEGYIAVTPDDVVMAVLPFFHIYGMVVVMISAMVNGAAIVTMPRFDMEQFLALVEKHSVTRVALVPPIIIGLTKHPSVDQYDLSSIQYINSGAAPLGAEITLACARRLDCIITQGYGLTETSPVTHISPYQPAQIKNGSVGLVVPNTEIKIVNVDTGEIQRPGQQGEILVRGPQVMKGYLNNVVATEAAVDKDGWLHTGDIGYTDEDEYLFIVDRLKELIKYKGFQVAPAELEAVLLSIPAVTDAAVIPVPDDEAGEIPKAFVVVNDEITPAQIMDFVAARVAPHKKIRVVEYCQEIPKSLSGKILRRVLVEREREQRLVTT